MTVGLCMEDVEIGLATHLRYIRPCTTSTDRIATRVTKGGLRPNQECMKNFAALISSWYYIIATIFA